ncbi:MAG: phosphoesterase [Myxococcales bacterium]|nr:phosphoesterase [Myxococcales bacterium]
MLDDDTQSRSSDEPEQARPTAVARLAHSRRGFLKGMMTAATASFGLGAGVLAAPEAAHARGKGRRDRRRFQVFRIRSWAARLHLAERTPRKADNGDEQRYADQRASFSKTLPHDDLGEVDRSAYRALLRALASREPADFEAIPLSPQADRRLANPQAAFVFDLVGRDGHATRLPEAPAFASAELSAEIAEVYWQALTRDVPFRAYDASPLVAAAIDDLNALPAVLAPTEGGVVTPGTLFRGETPGDRVGPYLSQFLWHDVPYGAAPIVQRYQTPIPGDDFMTSYEEWLAIQRGAAPAASIRFDATRRYLRDARGLGEYVHVDVLFQAYYNAAMILTGFGPDALDPALPYRGSASQGGFVTFGGPHLFDLVAKAARVALGGAWYHKWCVHRRLRPEVYAGRIENHLRGAKDYGLPLDLLMSEAVARVRTQQGNALLPMAYPEGSPTHPAYPAGHATVAGACATILKAFANEAFEIPDPVEASEDGLDLLAWGGEPLTLGGEIDKLAANISLGRDAAGVHYRTDARGIEVGESQAIGILQDYSRTYNEDFDGFTLTRFDGRRIRIVDGRVRLA